ncbi:MAG: alpha/beta hydrolase [Candidatus Dormibacteraeota bacterium]|nr:alpha/beta hydrolase [Candidatus Dormibacteraeota bacterium]
MSDLLQLAPPGKLVLVPGRGEMFVRDSGPESARRGTLLLLHGWMFEADLNWISCYGPLQEAGYRVIAVDHRGHGRGIRSLEPFRLADCADDCAGLMKALGTGPVTAVGYSMGGAITQLLAARHPRSVNSIVLCATTDQWQDNRRMRLAWKTMSALEFAMTHMSRGLWVRLLRRQGLNAGNEVTDWIITELQRNDPVAVAEAGREMSRYDARPWLKKVKVPAAVICPRQDELVPPRFQRQLAADLPDGRLYELEGHHVVVSQDTARYMRVLLQALTDLEERRATIAA